MRFRAKRLQAGILGLDLPQPIHSDHLRTAVVPVHRHRKPH